MPLLTERTSKKKRRSLGQRCKALALKGATLLKPLSRRLKRRARKTK